VAPRKRPASALFVESLSLSRSLSLLSCFPRPSKALAIFSQLVIVDEFSTSSWDLWKFSVENWRWFVENSSPALTRSCNVYIAKWFMTLHDDKKSSNRLCQLCHFSLHGAHFSQLRRGSTRGRAFAVGFVNVISLLRVSHAENVNPLRYLLQNAWACCLDNRDSILRTSNRESIRAGCAPARGMKPGMNSREFNFAARTNNFICYRIHTF